MTQVRRTMQRIKHALTERWYAYEEARKLAEKSPEYKSYLEVGWTSHESFLRSH